MILRSVKIRLYPNKEQEQTLNKVLGCYRFVYNQMLALKQEAYNKDKINLGLCELSKFFHGELLKDEQYSWLKEQNTKVMKQAIRQMLSAYDGFFKLGKYGVKSILPITLAIIPKTVYGEKHETLKNKEGGATGEVKAGKPKQIKVKDIEEVIKEDDKKENG